MAAQPPPPARRRDSHDFDDPIFMVRTRTQSMQEGPSDIPEISSASFFESLPRRCSQRLRKKKESHSDEQKELDSNMFEYFLEEVLWKSFSEEKRSSNAYFDCLWFSMYMNKQSKAKVLKWINEKEIFSKNYVFVPIVYWRHWSVLVLCHFGDRQKSNTKKPCMFLLDSLHNIDPKRLVPEIRRFVCDIYGLDRKRERDALVSEIPLLIPKVPQQTSGDACGVFALYFIYKFVQDAPEHLSPENYPHLLNKTWFTIEELEIFGRHIQSMWTGGKEKAGSLYAHADLETDDSSS